MPLTEEQKEARAEKRRMTVALKEDVRAHRDEAKRREWREKGMYLTREQAAAGEPCRGCGLPVTDNLGNWPGSMYLTPEQKVGYDADQARYKEMHPDCNAHRWSMTGSRVTHCDYCCPPLPLAPSRIENIQRILTRRPRREEEFDAWERTLTCGHIVKQIMHHTNQHPEPFDCVVYEVRDDSRRRDLNEDGRGGRAHGGRQAEHDDRVSLAERELRKSGEGCR